MSGLDLNAIPSEEESFYDTEPQFYTQAALVEMVEESPDPDGPEPRSRGWWFLMYTVVCGHLQESTTYPDSNPTTTIPTRIYHLS
jgi:hypothetical protein